MRPASAHPRFASRRGSALSMSIVLSVVMSALISALAWAASAQSQQTANLAKLDQAFYAADTGLQQLAWYCRNRQMPSVASGKSGQLKIPLAGSSSTFAYYNYAATWTQSSGSSVKISSSSWYATSASASSPSANAPSYALSSTVSPPFPGIGAVTTGVNFYDKSIHITGNFAVNGNITANGGNGDVTDGAVTYGGTFTGYDLVGSSTATQAKVDLLDFTAIGNNLEAHATDKFLSSQTGATFTFLGPNPVTVVYGDVTDPAFIGSGTLYVKGNVKVTTNNVTWGASIAPVNIVATGTIEFTDKISKLYGFLFAGGDIITRQVDIEGGAYALGTWQGNGNNGQGYIKFTAAPWFAAAGAPGAGSSTLLVSTFTGPSP